jgi:fermentation-respiration switch protein FrsA (DUF1100 family)
MSSPYRDELESLRAENARLRAELARRGQSRPRVAVALVALDVASMFLLRPWLNGSDDLRFWAGLGIVLALGIAAAASALGYKRSY